MKVSRNQIQFQFYFEKPLQILPTDKISFELNFQSFDKGIPREKIQKSMKNQSSGNLLKNIIVCIRLKVHHSQTFFRLSPLPQNL